MPIRRQESELRPHDRYRLQRCVRTEEGAACTARGAYCRGRTSRCTRHDAKNTRQKQVRTLTGFFCCMQGLVAYANWLAYDTYHLPASYAMTTKSFAHRSLARSSKPPWNQWSYLRTSGWKIRVTSSRSRLLYVERCRN